MEIPPGDTGSGRIPCRLRFEQRPPHRRAAAAHEFLPEQRRGVSRARQAGRRHRAALVCALVPGSGPGPGLWFDLQPDDPAGGWRKCRLPRPHKCRSPRCQLEYGAGDSVRLDHGKTAGPWLWSQCPGANHYRAGEKHGHRAAQYASGCGTAALPAHGTSGHSERADQCAADL